MTHLPKEKVYVGLSGGVDSAVCAAELKELGYDVVCIFIKCWGEGDECTAAQDESDAVKVATFLDLPIYVWDFVDEYKNNVLESFIHSYKEGFIPNPDILCNSEIKFGAFYNKVKKLDKDALIATGHYARIVHDSSGKAFLASGVDQKKDQSYFLYKISAFQDILQDVLFPIGEMTKVQVRDKVKSLGMPNYNKPDSQGLCFIGNVSMRQFLSNYIDKSEGIVINRKGKVIGAHIGLSFYTNGQRHGFTINEYHTEPLYVIGKSVKDNMLIVGNRNEAYSNSFYVSGVVLTSGFENSDLSVRVRNLGKKIPCNLEIDQNNRDFYRVELLISEFGVAPGQSAVFYKNDLVVGGGEISQIAS